MVRRLIFTVGCLMLLADHFREAHDMQIRSVGIDLGKTTFHLVALGENGKVLLKKKFSQSQLITFTANLQVSLMGMERSCLPEGARVRRLDGLAAEAALDGRQREALWDKETMMAKRKEKGSSQIGAIGGVCGG